MISAGADEMERAQAVRLFALLGDQQDLADVHAVLDELMGRSRFIEFEALRNLWFDGTLFPKFEQLLAPAADAVNFTPEVTLVDAEDSLVGVDERQGIELEPGGPHQHCEHAKNPRLFLVGERRRNPEHSEPPRGG